MVALILLFVRLINYFVRSVFTFKNKSGGINVACFVEEKKNNNTKRITETITSAYNQSTFEGST